MISSEEFAGHNSNHGKFGDFLHSTIFKTDFGGGEKVKSAWQNDLFRRPSKPSQSRKSVGSQRKEKRDAAGHAAAGASSDGGVSAVDEEVANLLQKINSAASRQALKSGGANNTANMGQTAAPTAKSTSTGNAISSLSATTPAGAAKCCRCTTSSASASADSAQQSVAASIASSTADNAPSSTTADAAEGRMINSRLNEFKVQELKMECRKRQLAVSGSKLQIMERLKPYEDAILAEIEALRKCEGANFIANLATVPVANGFQGSYETQGSRDSGTLGSQGSHSCDDFQDSHGFTYMPECSQGSSHISQGSQESYSSNMSHGPYGPYELDKRLRESDSFDAILDPSVIDVVASNLGQNPEPQGASECANRTPMPTAAVSTFPTLSGCSTVTMLTLKDIGTAKEAGESTVRDIINDYLQQQNLQGHYGSEKAANTISFTSTPAVTAHSASATATVYSRALVDYRNTAAVESAACDGITLHATPLSSSTTSAHNCESCGAHAAAHDGARNSLASFSFAQMGSGGYFTLESDSLNNNNSNGHCGDSSIKQRQNDEEKQLDKVEPNSNNKTQPNYNYYNSKNNVNKAESYVGIEAKTLANSFTLCKSATPHHDGRHASTDVAYDSDLLLNCCATAGGSFLVGADENDASRLIQFDPADPRSIANTLSSHEQMLSNQQKKIHELQRELAYSQQNLRHQQQMILMVKKSQAIHRDENGRLQTQAEYWLGQLDTKMLGYNLTQSIIQYKAQQQQLQMQMADHEELMDTEQRLQEQIHVDQCVEDIVRIIRQDPRTALLIVQLLRKYQIEHNAVVPTTTHADAVHQCQSATSSTRACTRCCAGVTRRPASVVTLDDEDDAAADATNNDDAVNAKIFAPESAASATVAQSSDAKPAKSRKRTAAHNQQKHITPSSSSFSSSTSKRDANNYNATPKKSRRAESVGTAAASGGRATTIDMEEIFRSVLRDAARPAEAMSPGPQRRQEEEQRLYSDVLQKVSSAQNDEVQHFKEEDVLSLAHQTHMSYVPQLYQDHQRNVINNFFIPTSLGVKKSVDCDYAKTHAFDDLMDVLRDDQEKSSLGISECDTAADFTLGYTSDELVNFLADENADNFHAHTHRTYAPLDDAQHACQFHDESYQRENFCELTTPAACYEALATGPASGYCAPSEIAAPASNSRDGAFSSASSSFSSSASGAPPSNYSASCVAPTNFVGYTTIASLDDAMHMEKNHLMQTPDGQHQEMDWLDNIDSIFEPDQSLFFFNQQLRSSPDSTFA